MCLASNNNTEHLLKLALSVSFRESESSEENAFLAWLAPRRRVHFTRLAANAVWLWMCLEAGPVLSRVSVACERAGCLPRMARA